MRIVTWNAQHGGGARATEFARKLVSLSPDVAVITEFRNGKTGGKIKEELQAAGLSHFSSVSTPDKLNTVLLSSSAEFEEVQVGALGGDEHRCAWAHVNGINVIGFYFPQNRAKAKLFEYICKFDSTVLDEKSMLLGDFNTGRHFLDEVGRSFYCAEYFDKLEELGWIDAWRSRNENAREFSWYSNAGNGFRIDHTFVSPRLNNDVRRVFYDHCVREADLSDHSAMIVDVESGNS